MPAWAFRRYGSAGLGRWYRLFTTWGNVLSFDYVWCTHESNESVAPCAACLRVDSVCPHCSPRRCLTGDDGALLLWRRRMRRHTFERGLRQNS
jgi:hypothetical protein